MAALKFARRLGKLAALATAALVSCYSPDLGHHIFKCDRGKCPDGLYCIDNVYCTAPLPTCAVGGVEVDPGVYACVGATTPTDPKTACTGGATTAMCDAMNLSRDVCAGITGCAYCCKSP